MGRVAVPCSCSKRAGLECCPPEQQERGAVSCGMAKEGGVDSSHRLAHNWDQHILPAGQQLMLHT